MFYLKFLLIKHFNNKNKSKFVFKKFRQKIKKNLPLWIKFKRVNFIKLFKEFE